MAASWHGPEAGLGAGGPLAVTLTLTLTLNPNWKALLPWDAACEEAIAASRLGQDYCLSQLKAVKAEAWSDAAPRARQPVEPPQV